MNRWVLLLIVAGCGPARSGRVSFPVSAGARAGPLVTDSGWAVSLSRAQASFEGVWLFGAPLAEAPAAPWRRAVGLVYGSAWAHPGHDAQGEALAEVLVPLEVDLLAAAPVEWGLASGVTGAVRTATLRYGPAGLALAGSASKGGAVVPWSAVVHPGASLAGLELTAALAPGAGPRLHVEVDLDVLLERVDFSRVGRRAAPLDEESEAFNGLARGVTDLAAYTVSFQAVTP